MRWLCHAGSGGKAENKVVKKTRSYGFATQITNKRRKGQHAKKNQSSKLSIFGLPF
jgi:hypothetical protein